MGKVKVTRLGAGEPARNVIIDWIATADSVAYKSKAIVSGRASNVQELLFEYSEEGEPGEMNATVFDVTVERVLAGSGLAVGT